MTRRLSAVAIAAVLAMLLSGCSLVGGGTGSYTLHAEFDRAFNLFVGSEVQVLGVKVGTIKDVSFGPDDRWVSVEMAIQDDVRLPTDVTARIVQGALLGERYILLDPPHTTGPQLAEDATIPHERTGVPAEFDEILSSLNDFLEDLPPDEVARLVRNSADVLEGRGEQLGQTIDDVAVAVEVLRENDDQVVTLASRLADLSGTLATRDDEIGRLIEDWNGLLGELAAERGRIDAALEGVAELSAELGDLLATHREDLTLDIRTLTRVLRTADRNIDELDLLLHGQSELYRHAQRVFDYEKNWLPLVNHSEGLEHILADRLANRLARVCDELGFTECADPAFWEGGLPEQICVAPLAGCPGDLEALGGEPLDDGDGIAPTPLADALRTAVELVPELPDALSERREEQRLLDEAETAALRVHPRVVP